MFKNIGQPTVISGSSSSDDRGSLKFINDLELSEIKRFYIVENNESGFIRAWHAHKKESKIFISIQGSILACAVKVSDFSSPNKSEEVTRVVLDSNSPSALLVPSGFANGFKTLTPGAKLLVFSTSSLEESKKDDFRYNFDYWNPWAIEYR